MKFISFVALFLLSLCCVPASAADIDLTKALTVGDGPKAVIEFTDPDCPFCRKASQYFSKRSDVTRHVFFYPLPRHPKAKEKAQYVLSQNDKAVAYKDAMSGRLDSAPFLATTEKGIKQQEEQVAIAKKFKVDSTPTFIINGRIIEGFDLKRIEEALGPR